MSFVGRDSKFVSTHKSVRLFQVSRLRLLCAATCVAAGSFFWPILNIAQARDLHEITVMQSTADGLSFLPIYIARYNHYFEDEGFRVNLVVTNGGGPDIAALVSGQAQFTAAGPINQLSLFQRGQKTLSVVSYFDRMTANLVIDKDLFEAKKLAGLSIDDRAKALKGLRISVTRLGSLTDMVARYYLDQAGLNPESDAKIVATTAGAPQIAALMHKEVDVASVTTPQAEEMVSKGAGVMLINNTQGADPAFVPINVNTILTMPDYARQNPEVVRAFVRAILKAEIWSHQHSAEESTKVMLSYVPTLDPKILTEQISIIKGGIPTTGCMSKNGIESVFKLFEAAGLMKKPMQWTDIATNEFLPQVCTP